jgi:tRNA A-37 threonylcarbamoyl transferase component Bud32
MMISHSLPRLIINSLKVILGEDYTILEFERLPSRRNEVYKILGTLSPQAPPTPLIAKYFKQAGITHETSILHEAHQLNLHVPAIIGTTADVLMLEYIDAPNLCDLITITPDSMLGKMLAFWLARFHTVFSRGHGKVLVKGDARIRNFLVQSDHLIGVDFEESHIGSYHEDLAVACASILDTNPIFTAEKIHLCRILIETYAGIRRIADIPQLKAAVTTNMIMVLWQTAERRGNPPNLAQHISLFEKGAIAF